MLDAIPIFTAIDLFSGAGGLSAGFTDAGFTVRAAYELDPDAVATYQSNLGEHCYKRDIADLDVETVWRDSKLEPGTLSLVAGGPPCQGFSVQRRAGSDDIRNSLPMEFARLVAGLQPTFFLFENVPGIRNRHGKEVLDEFVSRMVDSGYSCQSEVLDAVNYGVPQFRRRLFVVGERPQEGKVWFRFPPVITTESSASVTVRSALEGLSSPPQDRSPHPTVPNHKKSRLSKLNQERLKHIPPGGGMMDLPSELRANCHKNGAERIGHRYVYGRLHPDRPSATITARFDSFTRGKFAHPIEDRNLTLREGARLQTFSDDFAFEGSQESVAAQIGNAVPPRLAYHLAEAIRLALVARHTGRESVHIKESQPKLPFEKRLPDSAASPR